MEFLTVEHIVWFLSLVGTLITIGTPIVKLLIKKKGEQKKETSITITQTVTHKIEITYKNK